MQPWKKFIIVFIIDRGISNALNMSISRDVNFITRIYSLLFALDAFYGACFQS